MKSTPQWVVVMEGAKLTFLYETKDGLFGFTSLDKATRFESFEEGERYIGLKGITWCWPVREDLIEEWLVMRALKS